MKFCIPQAQIDQLKQALKGLGKDPFGALIDMSSKESRAFFNNAVGKDLAKGLNISWEKALIQDSEAALLSWAKKNLKDVDQAKEVLKKVPKDKLDDWEKYMDGNGIYEDFVNEKLGLKLTDKEVEKFTTLGRKLYETQKKAGEDFGMVLDDVALEKSIEVGKALKALKDYGYQLMPTNAYKVFVGTMGKAVMLLSIKSPFLNIESNTILGLSEALARRITNRTAGKALAKEKVAYMKKSYNLYAKTGFDITRALDFEDTVVGVGRMLGEETVVPKSKIMRATSDFVFDTTLSKPDVMFGGATFADSAGLLANKMAKGDKKLAIEIFNDSTRLKPTTKEGVFVREMAVQEARIATYTDESKIAKASLALKKLLNDNSFGVQVGEILMPFTKTPSNVVSLGFDYSGMGAIRGVGKIINSWRTKVPLTQMEVSQAITGAIRGGLGIAAAYVFLSNLTDEEFMGAYDPARQKIRQLKNSNTDSIKIAGKWVSLDYFGPLRGPIKSMLYARKYGKGAGSTAFNYTLGAVSELRELPAYDPIQTISNEYSKLDPEDNDTWLQKTGKSSLRAVKNIVISRTVPGIINDLAKGLDGKQRDTRGGKFKIGPLELDQLIAKMPVVRQILPEKTDALGRTMEEESLISSLLFGARVRTSRDDKVTNEIFRLQDTGNTPSIKDLKFSRSSAIKDIKADIGDDKFRELAIEFGKDTADVYIKVMDSSNYKKADDEEKKSMLDKAQTKIYNRLKKKYKPRSRSKQKAPMTRDVLKDNLKERLKAGTMTREEAERKIKAYDKKYQ